MEFKFQFLAAADRVAVATRLDQFERAAVTDIASLTARWQNQIIAVRDIRRQGESLQDLGPRLKELKDQLGELDQKVREAFVRQQNLETRKHGLESELKDLRATIGQMENLRIKLEVHRFFNQTLKA
jgi:hypothetical protein